MQQKKENCVICGDAIVGEMVVEATSGMTVTRMKSPVCSLIPCFIEYINDIRSGKRVPPPPIPKGKQQEELKDLMPKKKKRTKNGGLLK